jgi:hypothetical protein
MKQHHTSRGRNVGVIFLPFSLSWLASQCWLSGTCWTEPPRESWSWYFPTATTASMTPRCWIWCLICKRRVLALLVPHQCAWACSQDRVTQSGTLLPMSSRFLFSPDLIFFCLKHRKIMVAKKIGWLDNIIKPHNNIIPRSQETKALWWKHQSPCKRILCNI